MGEQTSRLHSYALPRVSWHLAPLAAVALNSAVRLLLSIYDGGDGGRKTPDGGPDSRLELSKRRLNLTLTSSSTELWAGTKHTKLCTGPLPVRPSLEGALLRALLIPHTCSGGRPSTPTQGQGNRETKLEYISRNGRMLMKSQLKQTDGRHTLLTFFRLLRGVLFIACEGSA